MTLRKTFFIACLIVSVLCLAAGFGITGQWIGAVFAIIMGPAWLLARKFPDSGLPLICLLASVSLAVAGILNGSPPLLMICGSGFALAVWDLLILDNALGSNVTEQKTRQYENKHLQSLAIAIGSGLIMVFLGRLLHFQSPFFMLVLLVALVLFGLDRVWSYIKKTG